METHLTGDIFYLRFNVYSFFHKEESKIVKFHRDSNRLYAIEFSFEKKLLNKLFRNLKIKNLEYTLNAD